MLAVLLFGCLAAAAAAPYYPHGPPPYAPEHHQHFGHYDPFAEDVFDTRQFWAQMANEMRQIDEMLASFSKRFPMVSQAGIKGNEYQITVPLSGFEEKDIVVKAKEGFLMVQAVHKLPEGGERMYLDAKTIPNCVNVTGTWTFEQGVLKIVFPLKSNGEETETETVTEVEMNVTEAPAVRDREEMESNSEENTITGELDERNLYTNEIPQNKVEATTYAVDLKDEVEFVPVRNYQLNL